MEPQVYCIPNAPKQNGDLWVEVDDRQVRILDPAGQWWRGRVFSLEEFCNIFKDCAK